MTGDRPITIHEGLSAGGDPLEQRDVVNRLRAEGHTVVADPAQLVIQFLSADDAEELLAGRNFGAAVAMTMIAISGVTDGPLHELWSVMMFGKDGDEHQRIRRTVSSRFTPKAVASMRPAVEEIAEDLVSQFVEHDRVDLLPAFAVPMIARSACAITGFPDEDAGRVGALSVSVAKAFGLMASDVADDASLAAGELIAYVQELIESDRVVEGSVLAGLLADDEVPLSAVEKRALAANLVFGGLDTTAKAIASGVVLLHEHHQAWDALVADPAGVAPNVVAETMRYFPPAPAVLRLATEDTECGGTTVPANTLAAANLDAVCRDPSIFEQPDDFDVTRTPGRHFTFGAGPHYCLGANLALLVMDVSFSTLATRFPQMTIPDAPDGLRWIADPFRGPASLPVTLR
ncbi:MAG: cytochrome P450 [Acidimicrobiales bacterium]